MNHGQVNRMGHIQPVGQLEDTDFGLLPTTRTGDENEGEND
jgi:hypothetical protein